MFNFGDLHNVPMVSAWVVFVLLIIILIWAVKMAKKRLVQLVSLGLIVVFVFSFYASTLSKDPAIKDPNFQKGIVKDVIDEVKEEINSEKMD